MRQWKLYLIVVPCSFFLLLAAVSACSQPPASTEKQPVSQKPAEFEVSPITFEPPVVMVGDSVTVSATVKNIGDITGTYKVALSIDGQEVESENISFDPGSSQEVSFQLPNTTAGSHKLEIGNSSIVLTVYKWSPYTIQYDDSDGVVVGAYVNGEQGHIVHFTPPNKAFRIQKIRIFGAAKIKNTAELKNLLTVRIWDKVGNNQLWSQDFPWSLFLSGIWQDIKVPDIYVDDDFLVEVVTHSQAQGDPIDIVSMTGIIPVMGDPEANIFRITGPVQGDVRSVVLIGFDYPQSYLISPSHLKRPETYSGYSYMGKLIDPGQQRLEGIQWLIRVDGEGATSN